MTSDDSRINTAWIPTKFAHVGKRLRIDDLDGIWTVTEVGTTWPEERVLAYERDYVKQRSVSDV